MSRKLLADCKKSTAGWGEKRMLVDLEYAIKHIENAQPPGSIDRSSR